MEIQSKSVWKSIFDLKKSLNLSSHKGKEASLKQLKKSSGLKVRLLFFHNSVFFFAATPFNLYFNLAIECITINREVQLNSREKRSRERARRFLEWEIKL